MAHHIEYNSDNITFKELTEADLTLMHRWLNTPHVSQWWDIDGKRNPGYEEVIRHFMPRIRGRDPVNCYLVLYDTRPMAYIQSCRMEDFPTEKVMLADNTNVAGIDIFIGEVDFLHKGVGAVYIRKFLKEIVFPEPGITSCLIDPEPANKIAIRAYQKAGFSYSHKAWNAEDSVEALYHDHKTGISLPTTCCAIIISIYAIYKRCDSGPNFYSSRTVVQTVFLSLQDEFHGVYAEK